jgi:hypothetical protein
MGGGGQFGCPFGVFKEAGSSVTASAQVIFNGALSIRVWGVA